jgi:predicted amidohydrolase
MRVAGIQFDLAWEDPAENFRRAAPLIERAAGAGARLVALPEMFNTGFSMNAAAVARHADVTKSWLADQAKKWKIHVVGGYAEPGTPRPANALSLMGPDGRELLHYQKVHPFSLAGEDQHFSGGSRVATATIDSVCVTPVICYDLRFPELFRSAVDATDLFVVIANWPEKRRHAWSTLLAARAIENQCFVLGVNRVGEVRGEPHSGDSALIDPLGAVRASVAGEAAVVAGEVDAAEVARVRERFPFLKDRRPRIDRSPGP